MAEATSPAGAPPPVMDVVAPPAEKSDKHESGGETDPVDRLAAADHRSQQTTAPEKSETPAAAKPAKRTPPAPAKEKESAGTPGIGLAITATVIVVLGLAALATYAYTQTNK